VLEYVQPTQFDVLDYPNHLRLRTRIRYLAALWPDADVKDLTHRIHGLMNNSQFDTDDVRLILQGRRINDPSRITSEVPLPIIQGIGRCLLNGLSLRSTAREMRVSYDTVEAIEKYLGIRQAREDRILDAAVDAARDSMSTRKFAAQQGVSKSRAHRLISKGHSVLRELGEV
jgi:transposase-like protein